MLKALQVNNLSSVRKKCRVFELDGHNVEPVRIFEVGEIVFLFESRF
jgi:hypothetical protein